MADEVPANRRRQRLGLAPEFLRPALPEVEDAEFGQDRRRGGPDRLGDRKQRHAGPRPTRASTGRPDAILQTGESIGQERANIGRAHPPSLPRRRALGPAESPVGLSTILFAEVNRRELGRQNVNTIRAVGLSIIYVSLAVPIWQFESFGAWVTLLICSLATIFLAIGLRLQTFLWMGLTTFVLDVVYEMGRVSLDYAFAKWAIMLAMGIILVMFVALNEKKRIVTTMRLYYEQARLWE